VSAAAELAAHPPRRWLAPGDPDWPAELDHLAALHSHLAVRRLWVEGNGELPPFPGVAVVGARRATAAALETARRIGADLARLHITVISGFAKGVDAAAHRGCLAVGGRTLAVLGCGLDVDYPPEHRELRQQIGNSGARLTEYEQDEAPESWHFPRRNRIIAALSDAVIVVEAHVESGALSTASWATRLGREVLAVPGSILSPANAGSNLLLRDGVRPYLDPSDLSDVFPQCSVGAPVITGVRRKPIRKRGTAEPPTMLPLPAASDGANLDSISETPEQRLVSLLGVDAVPREFLVRSLGIAPAELAVLLGELELAGAIRCLPGGLVVREPGSAARYRGGKQGPFKGQVAQT
jgi:DNA processing protein